jgi:hypothetical protein
MSHEYRIATLRQKFSDLSQEVKELKNFRKSAFLAAPPMPQGGAPPMDPAMMQQGGAPPMDPAMMQQGGAPPMDPAMMQQGAPPQVDPATGMPIDPTTGMPMDPAAMQGGVTNVDPATGMPIDPATGMPVGAPPAAPAAPAAPAVDPALLDQIVGLLEEMGQQMQQQGAAFEELKSAVNGELQDLGEQMSMVEKTLIESNANLTASKSAAQAW